MRALIFVVALVLVPLAAYWQTATYEYGFRDDYAHLREVREEPGKLFTLTTSNGRPVYGMLLEGSLQNIHSVPDLALLRLTSVVLLSLVGIALWAFLRRSGWSEAEAAAVGVGTALLPGAQVVVSWAIAWPIAVGLLAAVLGFWVIELHLEQRGARRLIGLVVGAALYFLAGLTYQTSALFAVVPLAALLLVRDDCRPLGHVRWIGVHIGMLFGSLLAGFLIMNAFFTEGVVPEAQRMYLEPHPFLKLLWFARNPLPNALALFELRDRFAMQPAFWAVTAAFAAIVALGYRYGGASRSQKLRWLFCVLALPFVAHSASLAASSQAIGYRTLLPLSGLFLVLVVFALHAAVQAGKLRRLTQAAALGGLMFVAAVLAQRNTFTLIAEPQNREWQLVRSAAGSLRLASDTDVYIIRPQIADRSTERIYDDEFGSLSSDADWAAKEMFKAALRERFPATVADGKAYRLDTGQTPPAHPADYDLVLDMRRLKAEGDRVLVAVGEATANALRR
jgi:hypothetical protein